MTTQLTVIERAAVALGASQHEANLRELVKASTGIKAVINADGRTEAHRAAMTLRNARTGIDKAGKDARDDANAFAKAVIAEAKRLADITEPEENRLLALRDGWDAKIEAEKQARIEAEKERVAGIQERVDQIRVVPLAYASANSGRLSIAISATKSILVDEESFEEFFLIAADAQKQAVDSLQSLHDEAVKREEAEAAAKAKQEADAAYLAEQKAELAKMRAEAAEQRKAEDAKRKADDAKRKEEDASLAKAQAAAKAEQDRIVAEFAAERAKLDAERKAFEQAQAAERAAKDAAERAEREKAEAVERQAKAVAAAEEAAKAKAAEVKPIPEPALLIPSADEIITLIAGHYKVPDQVAKGWLQSIDFTSLTAAAA